ncbi:hypothetical protein BX265_4724 [Streptomyces sp. TLI_235]|nr:hypothetical protein [Streptomyces sp. TLI_235]PBC79895.1 hypothetical protein BX265_4724 [Streptomyces sp. TLI_235]
MTASSEQVAWQMYTQLDAQDRAAVDAWRSLGNDLTTSLLSSGVLGGQRHPAGDPDDVRVRMASRDADYALQLVAEHEAAHAIVARALGLGPVEIEIADDMSGVTRYAKTSRMGSAIVAVAAEVWITDFRYFAFPGGDRDGCRADRRALLMNTGGDVDILDASRRAYAILAERREEVLAAAHRLAQDRRLELI